MDKIKPYLYMLLAALLPIKLLNNDSFFFLTHGPKYRRQFLDWGVFHVKHQFLSLWREYQQCLKQRNLALKRLLPTEQIIVWDKLLIKTAMTINALRKEYISELLLVFKGLFKKFLDIQGLVINFYQGWPKESEFAAILEDNLKKDRDLGYTYYGLHRADLKITINNKPAQDVLSRGQQKVFIWTLNLAQTLLLKRQTQKSSVILMDDLPSELDANKRQAIFDILDDVNAQVFITAIDKNIVESIINNMDDSNYTMFHVKHGEISYSRDRLDGI